MILLRCSADSRHGFWSSQWVKMGRPPADPAMILREFKEQASGWAARVAEIEPGILLGEGINKNCRVCGVHLIPVPPAILAEAERQHALNSEFPGKP